MLYHNFDIAIDEATTRGYPVRAQSENFGEARGILLLDLDHTAVHEALISLEDRQTDMEELVRFGTRLYTLLFTGEIETIFQQSFGHARASRDTGLRVRLRIGPPEIAALPWEAMYFPAQKCFMGSSMSSPLVRYLEIAIPIPELSIPFPIRMLVVIPASVSPYPELNSAAEKEQLDQALHDVKNQVHIRFLEGNVTLEQLSDALNDRKYNCLHFIGHGGFRDDRGCLLFNTEEGAADYVDESRFVSLFQNHPTMKLVVLNSCHGASISSTRSLSGIAPGLVTRGIPAVVAMKYAIDDRSAIVFAREFYRKLFRGWDTGRVDVAMVQARNRLSAEVDDARDYCTPVLYLRAREGILFTPQQKRFFPHIPWAKSELHRIKAVYDTYQNNSVLTGNPEDREAMSRLARLETLRRYGQICGAIVACVLFLFSWVGAFDLLNLDTLTEMYSMRLGEWVADTPFNENIVIVTTDQKVEKSWRGQQHPELLGKLAEAGAKTVAFDMVFEEQTAQDNLFAAAIEKAKARGTQVVVGVQKLDEQNRVKIAAEIQRAIPHGLGNTCIGQRLRITQSVPLVVVKQGDSVLTTDFAFSLVAYAAFKGLKIDFNPERDMEKRHVHFTSADGHSSSMQFAEVIRAKGKQWCALIADGDLVGNLVFAPVSTGALRDPNHRLRYEMVLGMPVSELVPHVGGKLVLVGGEHDDVFSERRGWLREKRYGVEYHAEAVSSLLHNISVQRLSGGWQFMVMALLGFLGSSVRGSMSAAPRYKRCIASTCVVFLTFCCVLYLYAAYHLLVNILYPIGAFAVAYLVTGKIDRRILT